MSQFGEEFINTELNTDGIKEGAKEINETLESTAKDAAKSAEEIDDSISKAISDASQNAQASFDEISQGAEDTAQEVNNAFNGTGEAVNTALNGAADILPESVNEAVQKSKGFIQDFIDGFKEGFSEAINTEGAVDFTKTTENMEETAQKTQSLKDKLVDALDEIALKFYQSDSPRGEMMGNTFNALAGTVEKFGETTKGVFAGIARGAGSIALAGVKKLASGIGTLIVNGAKLAKSGIVTGLKKIGSLALQGAKRVLGLGKNASKMGGGFGSSLKQMLKFGLGISSLFILFNKLRSAITDGMKNLARYDKETNASISSVSSALATLKNALATAFAPILNVVAPIITSFINKLTQLATAIGMVIAKLTGKGTFTKAVAVQKDYAKSLDKSGKSAKNATLSIDELNQSVDDSQSGGGDAGAGEMFEEVPIDEQSSDFADKLKAMWENADFTGLGMIIGGKLAQALDSIDWGGIQAIAGKIGKGIATLINGFVEFPDLGYKIGKSIAQAFNTALEFVYQFVSNLHWESIGTFIGDGINGFFENFDWLKLADTISTGLKGALDGITAFLKEVDWQMIGENLWDAVEEIDYAGIAKSLFEALGAALASAVELIWGFIKDAVIGIRDYFKQYIDEYIATTGEDNMGVAIIMGILNGIIDGIKNIGQWIYDNIFTPFINGFKEAFEIHSPSQVMAEMGGYIIDGLFGGLQGLWEKVKGIFITFKTNIGTKVDEIKKSVQDKFTLMKNNVKTTISNLKTNVVSIFNTLKTAIKTPINGILGIIESFCNAVIRGINKLINAINGLLDVPIPDWVTEKTGITGIPKIPTLAEVSLPRLATGTVVPRQASEFAAILGDNNQETEVVSPLSTIREAVADVMQEYLAEIAENTRELADKDFSVSIGDREIARANRRGEKLLGYQLAH